MQACEKSECVDDEGLPPSDIVPRTLAETGLYAGYTVAEGGAGSGGAAGAGGADAGPVPVLDPGVALGTLASYVRGFEPKYPLWADAAEKQRYVYIPKCSTIDTSDMDHWRFPVGTRFWKEFTAETKLGASKVVVETRVMHKFGPGEGDWIFAAYQWDTSAPDDPAAAISVPNGVTEASGTGHDIPALGQCINCHGTSEKVLGFGAIQLSHDTAGDDLTIEKISRLGWLTDAAPGGFLVPGTPTQQAALGYLHGNCGGCHYQGSALGAGVPNDNTPLVLRLLTDQKTYEDTDTVKSSVGVIVASGNAAIVGKPRIDPMAPDTSAILLRMKDRGTPLQMPPLATTSTKVPDTAGGVSDVTAWVNSIPKAM
jgi:mono/diheme cytochrome c family protein